MRIPVAVKILQEGTPASQSQELLQEARWGWVGRVRVDLEWIWRGFGVDLEWIWSGFGVDLEWIWGGFGVDLEWI